MNISYFAGCPKTNNTARCVTKLSRFHGCMQQIFIDDEPVDIDVMLQRKWGRYAEILLGTCGITDRCVCEREGGGGVCVYVCVCVQLEFVCGGFANTEGPNVLTMIVPKQTALIRKSA